MPLSPGFKVLSRELTAEKESQFMGTDLGYPAASTLSPLSPPRLNFIGTDWPALAVLSTVGLLTGAKKPVNARGGVCSNAPMSQTAVPLPSPSAGRAKPR